MKEHRIVPANLPVTTIHVDGQPRHFFQSEKLGKCRAILSENLPHSEKSHADMVNEEIDLYEQESRKKAEIPQKNMLSKGKRLEILMGCSDRLHKRWLAAWDAYHALPVNHVHRIAAWKKLDTLTKANSRVSRKIALMLEG
jgi:hypothetical protein